MHDLYCCEIYDDQSDDLQVHEIASDTPPVHSLVGLVP